MIALWLALLAQATKLPVPSAAEQATVEKELHRMWKADYALPPAQRAAVAKKFLARGTETFEAPFKYVIFREAREMAAQAGDAATAMGAIEAMTAAFGLEGVTDKAAVLARIKAPEVAALELELVDEAITIGRLETAAAVLSRLGGRAGKDELRELAKRLNHALEIRAAMAGLKDWASPWMYVNPNDLSRGPQYQRDNVWTSAPKGPEQPFKWVRTVQLSRATHLLYVEVCAEKPWTLVVHANGDELTRKEIMGSRWQSIEIPLGAYSNRVVTLEVANATDRAYWSNLHILPPPLAEVLPSDNDSRRAAVPDAERLARGEKLAQEILQGKPGAAKLLEEARKMEAGSGCQYVILRKARDLGMQAGDLQAVSDAVDLMGAAFSVDPFEEKLALFSKLESLRKTSEGADWYLKIAAEAVAAGRSEAALHAVSRARSVKIPGAGAKAKEAGFIALETLSRGWAQQWLWQDTAPGQVVQDTFNKRPYAWQTQPAAPERPFKWKRRVKLAAGQPCWLQMDVSSRLPDDHHGWEWTLVVGVNGKESLTKQVRGVEWRHYSVDLSAWAGREVELELCNRSDDGHGHGQTGYWDKVHLAWEP